VCRSRTGRKTAGTRWREICHRPFEAGNCEVVGIGNIVEKLQNKAQDLIAKAAFLNYVHADIQDVFQEFVGLSRDSLIALLLARLQDSLPEHVDVACLDRNTHHLLVLALLVTRLEDPARDTLEILLDRVR
jgi:hypothetical protein